MDTKLVLRILDASGLVLLGWTEVRGHARGDGCLWPGNPLITLLVEQTGRAESISIHWADLHVETKVPFTHPVKDLVAGQTLTLAWEGPILTVGNTPGYLIPVTVRNSTVIGMASGVMGMRT